MKPTENAMSRRTQMARGAGAAVGTFIIATVALALTVTLTGNTELVHGGEAAAGQGFIQMTSAAAFSIASAVMSLVMASVSFVTAAGATVLSLAFGAAGIVGAAVVGLGVVTGPVLLIAAIVILVKRRFFPDVI
ncbi:hypothetical protein [Parvularcula maris]|uniref:Uncharacterized protein n=1 Tax=Parvularcula maris TaxID=2965077 RepID=A0A9X2RIT0_9PROT|nr:hypothetical protein [Parvularcula maris]MCQ8184187.1 hypothetical protein [Parvularcula maris]